MNVIDIGCSFIKSYVVSDKGVQSCFQLPVRSDHIFKDIRRCFEKNRQDTQSTIVISTSDCVVWESKMGGNPHWLTHDIPKEWQDGLTSYKKSRHPRYDKLKGAANQMLYLGKTVGLENIKRILPLSAYIATEIADNPDWNGWDITHASNSGFWDYDRGGWADAAQPFIDAGVIDEKIYPCDTLIEGNTFRRVFLGGHDSVFANANDEPRSSKSYISCGTWTTVSVMADRYAPKDSDARFVAAPNGSVLEQLCFLSDPSTLQTAVTKICGFLDQSFKYVASPTIQVFGSWSKEMYEVLNPNSRFRFEWLEPNRFWGCLYLPEQVARYVRKSSSYRENTYYFCEGA